MKNLPLLTLFTCLLISLSFPAEPSAPILAQHPTMNRTHIVFGYAGDLWSVGREGGEATRLTTGAGAETDPVFSPDGTQIAFTGEYDGNVDVFVIPASGGIPKRLTWHPAADYVLGWTPDGQRILFASTRASYARFAELFTVGIDGGFEKRVPLPIGFEGAYSPDGQSLAYVPVARAFSAWKRYRGGMATPIWIARLSDGHVEKIPRKDSNDYNPLWIKNKVYFLSDREGPVSLFCYDTQSKQVRRVLENNGLDLKSAGAGPDAIVYEQFGSLHLYDLQSGKTKPVPIHIAGDLLEVREHFVNVSKRLHNAHLSPSGARAVFEAHGEILTLPAEKGDLRNLTNTPGVMERDPIWSPDGKTVAYFSDESGEYTLQIRNQNGMGEITKISLSDKSGFYLHPVWSPDGKKIAYLDSHLALWYVDLDRKKAVKVDKDRYYPPGYMVPDWSPDSKWLVYSKRLPNYLGTIYLYSVADAKCVQVTDGMSDAQYPVFDKDGKYLYFAASTDSGASLQPDIHSFTRPVSRTIYVAVLAKDLPSPLGPESDEEKAAAADKNAAGESPAKTEGGTKEEGTKSEGAKPESSKSTKGAVPVKIDFENLSQRILALPLPARRYINLQVGKTGVVYAAEAPMPGPGAEPALTVHRFDLSSRKSDIAIGGVRSFEISRNGEKMLYRQGERWVIAASRPMAPTGSGAGPLSAATGPAPGAENTLKTDSIEVRVDPKAEWRQMYGEAWRIERDFFYDPHLHGLDLAAAEEKYRPYLESVASRRDLTYLFQEMLGEITVSHLGVFGGDTPDVKRIQTGLLGADYKVENGRYQFVRVYNGENWNPDAKAPLTQPGVNVVAGEYLLAVNGRELRVPENVYAPFEGTAGKITVLRVGPSPNGTGSREVTVVPISDESRLRNLAWVEDNRRKVDQATHGRVAYIYMPDTAFGGYTNFNRYFFAQVGKEAAIVDERYNAGGALATDIIEYLKRTPMSLVATRDGADEQQPQGAIYGPKVMIVNEFAGSGGDAMPWYFHRAGVGPLVGKRTWGGLVGRAGAPPLMDDGIVTAPSSGVWNPNGRWEVENHGIDPDIEVDFDPEAVRAGHDPQLEKAIALVMNELEKHPLAKPKRPPYPNYHTGETNGKLASR